MSPTPSAVPLLSAKGVNGQIDLYANKLTIKRKGLLALMGQGVKGDKEILLSSITSIQYKKPGMLNGYIQFAFSGGTETKSGILDAAKDENTVMFNAWQKKDFDALKLALDQAIEAKQMSPTPSVDTVSPYEQIEKLAELRAKGVLTDEEFTSKKRQLLNL